MVKIVVQNDANPDIGIVLKMGGFGWSGQCTHCGAEVQRFTQEFAIKVAQRHIDKHDGEE